MPKIAISFLFVLFGASAQTLTICEVLSGLEDLNHQEIKVRGSWAVGHVGEVLIATSPCNHPTVRDGWIWQDAIQVFAQTDKAKAFADDYRRIEKSLSTMNARIVATLSGRLETRNHFEIVTLPSGVKRPTAFGYFVALLRYERVEDMTAVPFKPGESERELEIRRRPEPKQLHK
jgi:hypothetical protein